jgi:hypothetical protein
LGILSHHGPETLSVSLLGITQGDPQHFESDETYRQTLIEQGLVMVEEAPLQSVNWAGHYLSVARKNLTTSNS